MNSIQWGLTGVCDCCSIVECQHVEAWFEFVNEICFFCLALCFVICDFEKWCNCEFYVFCKAFVQMFANSYLSVYVQTKNIFLNNINCYQSLKESKTFLQLYILCNAIINFFEVPIVIKIKQVQRGRQKSKLSLITYNYL